MNYNIVRWFYKITLIVAGIALLLNWTEMLGYLIMGTITIQNLIALSCVVAAVFVWRNLA